MSTRVEQIQFAQFGTLTAEEWLRFSVCEVNKPSPQGGSDKNREGTPYDPRMGVLENGVACGTCEGENKDCPGHFGHIVLPIPVYNPVFLTLQSGFTLKILQCVCPSCARPRLLPDHAEMQNLLRIKGYKRLRAFSDKCKKVIECPWPDCAEPLPWFDMNKAKDEVRRYYGSKEKSVVFNAGEALNVFIRISNETVSLLGFNEKLAWNNIFTDEENLTGEEAFHVHQFRPESLILTVLPVIPPFSRPFVIRDGQKCDDDLTDKYNSILKASIKLREDDQLESAAPSKGRRRNGKLSALDRQKTEYELQNHIWTMMNNKAEKSKLSSGGRPHKCLWSRLQGKDGRVQTNVAGKRTDFSARSVIVGGGIMLKMDYLGVPRVVAEELTKRELVKEWNHAYLQDLVSQGKVNRVIRRGGVKRLNTLPDKGVKFTLMVDDVVERQLRDGDIVLFNRQPTLRLESMLAFRVKIIEGYAFRLGLCWTSSFNADFDGDEMNLHVPQSIGATAEAEVLMRAAVHIVTGQRNGPVNGIVQDGLIGSYILTNGWEGTDTDTMVSATTFAQCITGAEIPLERYADLLLRAAKYYPDYITVDADGTSAKITADEVPGKLFVSILLPANFCYKRSTDTNPMFPEVKIEDGVILPDSGPLCKKIIGGKTNSVIHVLWKDYSPEVALMFLSETQQLVDRWLPTHGFSMGISDCLATSRDEVSRVIAEMQAKVNAVLEKCHGEPDEASEAEINSILNSAMNVGLRLAKNSMAKGDRNALNIMRNSGAKGSLVNLIQIVAFVGQQNIDGRRIPTNLSDNTRTLPHYEPGDHSAEARGFVEHGYLEGLTPQEVFFHAAGGRVGIIATAIKTATTGYIQKRICRKVEDFRVETDGTVRDANGRIIQFLYGDDGMDPKKLCYARGADHPFFVNPYSLSRRLNSDARRERLVGEDEEPRPLRSEEIDLLSKFIHAGPPKMKTQVTETATSNARFTLVSSLKGVVLYECKIPIFCAEVRGMYESSKAQYGDMVGLVAATSIGEPTTQMTLNTFHGAGLKGKDVSLGVPRFDELLNATKSDKQKHGSCTVYFDIPVLTQGAKTVSALERENASLDEGDKKLMINKSIIQQTKETGLAMMQSTTKSFEETTVGTFFEGFEIQYLPEDIDPDTGLSPIGILTYEEYKPEWWVTLSEELRGKPEFEPESWVLIMKFDTEEMFRRNVDIEDIAIAIEEASEGKYCCVPSPNVLGTIEVYCNFTDIKAYVRTKFDLPPGESKTSKAEAKDDGSESSDSEIDLEETDLEAECSPLLTEENVDFFTCRDVAVKYIKSIRISGITGVSKVYPREESSTHEWVMDVECRQVSPRISVKRFLDILTAKGVDSKRTICDDMHSIYAVLGIEAAQRFLIEEMTRIISFDGTYINPRHIQLLVDSMTHTGVITSVRRDGIPRDVGPIAKIMFEQAVDNAVEAAVFTEPDHMAGVSSAIMYGLTAKSGTGLVDVKSSDKIPARPIRVPPNEPVEDDEVIVIDVADTPPAKPKAKAETAKAKATRRNTARGSRRKNVIKNL